jgi:hypothetical protein
MLDIVGFWKPGGMGGCCSVCCPAGTTIPDPQGVPPVLADTWADCSELYTFCQHDGTFSQSTVTGSGSRVSRYTGTGFTGTD